MNGITDIVSRSDLLDRSLIVTLPAIPNDKRRTESELSTEFEKQLPQVFGALLSAVSVGLKNLPDTKLANLPRMADFARWSVACEPALNCKPGTFMQAYTENRDHANFAAIESCLVGPAILSMMESRESWQGTVKELLEDLEELVGDRIFKRKGWPASPRKLSNDLRRITPNLRVEGINVIFQGHTNKGTIVDLVKTPTTPSPSSPDLSTTDNSISDKELSNDGLGDEVSDELSKSQIPSPTSSPHKSFNDTSFDEGDESDGVMQNFSEDDIDERPDVSDEEMDPRAWDAIEDDCPI